MLNIHHTKATAKIFQNTNRTKLAVLAGNFLLCNVEVVDVFLNLPQLQFKKK